MSQDCSPFSSALFMQLTLQYRVELRKARRWKRHRRAKKWDFLSTKRFAGCALSLPTLKARDPAIYQLRIFFQQYFLSTVLVPSLHGKILSQGTQFKGSFRMFVTCTCHMYNVHCTCHMYSSEPCCFLERIAAPQRDVGPSKNKLGHPTEKWRNSLCWLALTFP